MSRPSAASVRGYLVHAYTASTLLFVVLGMQWLVEERYQLTLLAMAATVIIDATDGAMARRSRVTETATGIQGDLLDNIVDFLSYVALPVLFLLKAEMLLAPATLWAALMMFASAFGFSRADSKLPNKGFFAGFPSYWNVVVFYLYLLETHPLFNTVLLLLLAVSVFSSLRFLYVTQLTHWRALHLVLSGVWGLLCLAALLVEPGALRAGLLYASFGYVAFYLAHSVVSDIRDRRSAQ